MPRDHFKSTLCTEGLPMWKALPFGNRDEDLFRALGYGDAFIRWMRRAHNTETRILLISENISNAAKLGRRIRGHFENNALYRTLFPETLPDTSCIWTNYSLHVKRNKQGSPHGEGTFDFLGVGSALQSRHYTGGIIQDDIVGRAARESPTIMETTIDYHKHLPGAFEDEDPNHEGDELIVGNRWAFHDLNSHIREHEPWFKITSHGALGGCCSIHPPGLPIFPEEFSLEKLMRIKQRQGSYIFSCQYLNDPSAPEDADFREGWLRYYTIDQDERGARFIRHEVKDGIVIADMYLRDLAVAITTDPNHGGQTGRARHAIVVTGKSATGFTYVLETWAEASSYQKYFDTLYATAKKWKIRKVGFETVAAQKYAAYHIDYRNAYEEWPIRVVPLKGEVMNQDGSMSRNKEFRIRNVIAPIAEFGKLFIQRSMLDFIGEYSHFPRGKFCDLLDAFAYHDQVLRNRVLDYKAEQELLHLNQRGARLVNSPYSLRVQ